MMKKNVVLISILFFSFNSFSQDKEALCGKCVEGLRTATFDTYGFTSENNFKSFLSTYFSMTDEQRLAYRNSNSTSAGIKAVIDEIPIGFTGSNASEEDREEYKKLQMLFQQNQDVYSNDMVKIYEKLVDQRAITAYENCITTCIRTVGGASALAYTIEGDLKDEFIFTINWRPLNDLTTSKVSSFQFTNLLLKNGASIYTGADFKAFTPITQAFKRIDPSKPASISVSFIGLGEPISVTLEGEDKLANSLPVGTIIASIVNYQQFAGQVFNDAKSIWAPADGRSVANSTYGKNINPNVPDLRGQFLRGFNQFYSPGEPLTIINGADPDTRVIINNYSYQKQQIISHTHNLKDPGHSHNLAGIAFGNFAGDKGAALRPMGVGAEFNPQTTKATTNITIESYGGKETRPNNIAVYYYIKINS
jgi:hypothetical protein